MYTNMDLQIAAVGGVVSLIVVGMGAINAWQNISIKLAISELRYELSSRVSANESKIAVLESNSSPIIHRKWTQ